MKTAAARGEYSGRESTLYLALELGLGKWKLGFTVGLGQKPRLRTIEAGDLVRLAQEIARAKDRFGLPRSARVVSCYEAGRDGFWLHRALVDSGVESLVVDSSSIEINRRARRAKTDQMDVTKLVSMLARYDQGEKKVWSVVNVPSVEEEDHRQLHRELTTLKREQTRQTNSIKGLLAGHGVRLEVGDQFPERLKEVRLWDGSAVPPALQCRLVREHERLVVLRGQIRELEAERSDLVEHWQSPAVDQVRRLLLLRGIGINSAWLYVMEFFGWRRFRNRRELASLAGLTPTPYQSGGGSREQGISKAGNRHIRAMAIEIAWGWLRFQPRSQLSLWYQQRFGQGGTRARKVGIVALARKLLVALWQYLELGVVPEGAILKG